MLYLVLTMKRLFKIIFTCYCLLPFALSFLMVIPAYFILFNCYPREKSPAMAHRLSRLWAEFLFSAFFIRLKIKNAEILQANQVYIFISNHRSLLDIPAYALACQHTFRFLSKAELSKVPLLGYVIKNLYITVNRTDKKDRHRSIEKMLASLREGISVFLAPEGTRNLSELPLLEFKDGAFQLAVTSQLPIAALVLHGTDSLLSPKRPFELSPGILYAEWLPPYPTAGMTDKNLGQLKEKIKSDMESAIRRGPSVE